ncbi:MotA/TolQ/ExbB proton channel family protein [Verrucomicrobiaceae bacterium N1E253]|uniref:MotA/TolQ/ExbB proton channel family protein n=1 Tax=Oceaniferula marina TaxID=2748318 RepID=A0A851GGE1_9BACT|nr:MotA/TolQ/ExbB proton channel family protein [Oceaniferula marina]NWK54217.1 MotA/TolQ/ExbB proton channel family protein [Oceaniferula marina]
MDSSDPPAWQTVWGFFSQGGWFMIPILLCSIIAVAVIVFKLMTVSKALVMPDKLVSEVEQIESYLEAGHLNHLDQIFSAGDTALARLCDVALHNAGRREGKVQEAVQSAAREEIVKMHAGMSALEVVITIAPLLGLLGTASGLVVVFAHVGQSADHASVGQGISIALNTTVAGLAVAVPTVIAHSHFNRKIETMAARLEVIMGKVISAFHHQQAFFGRHDDA